MTDDQSILSKIIEGVIMAGMAIIGYFLKDQHRRLSDTNEDLQDLKVKVAEKYVHNDVLAEFKKEIREDLKEIKDLIRDSK